MNVCTGIMGRQCSCGLWHSNGGRQVDTQRHEAPTPRPLPRTFEPDYGIEGPEDDFLKKDNAIAAGLRVIEWAVVLPITVCAICWALAQLTL